MVSEEQKKQLHEIMFTETEFDRLNDLLEWYETVPIINDNGRLRRQQTFKQWYAARMPPGAH